MTTAGNGRVTDERLADLLHIATFSAFKASAMHDLALALLELQRLRLAPEPAKSACPACGCEEVDHRNLWTCRCPARLAPEPVARHVDVDALNRELCAKEGHVLGVVARPCLRCHEWFDPQYGKNMNEPPPGLLDSMAFRYRHDFGLLSDREKDSIRTTMRQLWEEVAGKGFYRQPSTKVEKSA